MQYLALQYLGSLVIAMLIGALLGYLWRRFVATGGFSKSDYEDLQRKYRGSLAETEKVELLVKKGETRNRFLTADLSTKDRIIDRLQADSARHQSEIFKLRQKGSSLVSYSDAVPGDSDYVSGSGSEEDEVMDFLDMNAEVEIEDGGDLASMDDDVKSNESTSDSSSAEEGQGVSMHEHMAIVTELDRTRKENLRLSKEIASPDLEGEPSMAAQEMKKELTLAYSTISDLRAALASAGKTVSLRKHNELRDEYVQIREALRRVQSQVSDQSDSVSQMEFSTLADKLSSCQSELSQCKSELEVRAGKISDCQEEVFRLRNELDGVGIKKEAAPKATEAPKKKVRANDDLTKIKGIGPVIQKQLRKMGITTFEQVAAFKAADIKRVGEELGTFPDRIKRDKWVSSAKKLHKESTATKRLVPCGHHDFN